MIKKEISKSCLFDQNSLDHARKEALVQSRFDHPNIVKLINYSETREHIQIAMEYANDPLYFERRLEVVSTSKAD